MALHALNCTDRWKVESRGFSAGINPLQYNFPIVMIQLMSIFSISRTLHFILKPLSQPMFICNVMAGFILGPSVLGRIKNFRDTFFPPTEIPILHVMSAIGVIYFLFLVSVKLELQKILKSSSKKVLSIGISGIILPIVINVCLYLVLDKPLKHHLVKYERELIIVYVLVLPLTAFPHVAQSLDSINLLTSEIGHLAMSCAVVNDGIRIMMVVILFLYQEINATGYFATIVLVLAIMFVTVCILRPIPQWIIKHTPEGEPVKKVYLTGIMVGALIMGALSHVILGSALVGVCCFGLSIPAGPPLGSALVKKVELLAMELFLPMMYLVIGLHVEVDSLRNMDVLATYEVLFFGEVVGKFVGTLIPALLIMKLSFKNATTLSLMMNIKGVLEAMAFLHYKSFERTMEAQQYTVLVLSTMALTAIVTPLISCIYKPGLRLHRSSNKHTVRTIHAANQSIGELRVILCIYEEETVGSVISLLEASNPTFLHPISACVVHLVELDGRDAPILVPYHHKDLTGKSSKSDQIMNAFSKYSTYSSSKMTILPFTLVAPVKYMHECIHRMAEDKDIPLIVFPINKFQKGAKKYRHHRSGVINPLDNLRLSLQENAPCTVGLLLNIGSDDPMRYTRFSYKVGVIFIGGIDDREALAYAIRMSEHPGVSIMVLRLFFHQGDNAAVDNVEKWTDDHMVNEYRVRNAGNACALYCEETVDGFLHAIRSIKSLDSDYDLLIVGRRRCTHKYLDEEMTGWNENPELGIIGDVLVTYNESVGGMVSVLILQCHN